MFGVGTVDPLARLTRSEIVGTADGRIHVVDFLAPLKFVVGQPVVKLLDCKTELETCQVGAEAPMRSAAGSYVRCGLVIKADEAILASWETANLEPTAHENPETINIDPPWPGDPTCRQEWTRLRRSSIGYAAPNL